MGSAFPGVKTALVAALTALYADMTPPPLVSYGDPGKYQPNQIVAVMGTSTLNERPVMSPARPREEIMAVEVVFSVFAPGTETQQETATEAAYVLHDRLADFFKTKPNETLSGACREAWVSGHDLTESIAVNPKTNAVTGRIAEIRAAVTVRTRV
jgi:hypothetical protein